MAPLPFSKVYKLEWQKIWSPYSSLTLLNINQRHNRSLLVQTTLDPSSYLLFDYQKISVLTRDSLNLPQITLMVFPSQFKSIQWRSQTQLPSGARCKTDGNGYAAVVQGKQQSGGDCGGLHSAHLSNRGGFHTAQAILPEGMEHQYSYTFWFFKRR